MEFKLEQINRAILETTTLKRVGMKTTKLNYFGKHYFDWTL